ncbi:N-acetylated-alpha-linked acidic dipeptidase [Catalinimonas alkaloidigena]|uniref:N-acetylated-alpha-linked acidic dipeptidase n=1 Tax=Catalinimonas alkaloidigena TaxID=1075417 RepID=A0A1G8Y9A3_9BACT|nr:transferrin receptor-like dimerization domain-containing protein [Catalinimonas alkaloidigena]SDJ98795.1 N-acetylated-alpha-linked acidic dipeptidase [Catalinimonas alkaloidigena]
MKHASALLLSLLFSSPLAAQDTTALMGFTKAHAAEELQREKQFDQTLKAENLRQWMQRMAAEPHHVGSAYDKDNAEWMAKQFKSWGYDTKIETYQVLFPSPKVRVLEMVEPTKFTASLAEPALAEDATSGQTDAQLPTYNAYSTDGDVTAELVFVNYGVPDDYEKLEEAGIDVKGKIVIAKYYGSWRGIKPKLAAEKGAIGCLIYSDPQDDGYFQGDVYPKGAFKSEYGVQRGSVMDMPLYPGDPLTPGYAATKKAKRLDRSQAETLTKIPVLPISYHDAQPLLEALQGPVAPEKWRGALPFTYHIGPGPVKVHLKLEFNWDQKEIYNVIATMKGSEFPDQWVLRGNHHDAWVNGAADPVSGMVALMEEARAVSELAKTGWKPKRTIVYCGWDAEETGLIGSTEWVEDHAAELQQKAVAYINTDGNSRGFLFMGGSHTLEAFCAQIAGDVQDPQKKVSVLQRRKAFDIVNGGGREKYKGFTISALGSGSDYTPFLQHLGIASLNLGYGGEGSGGEYHSIYDSYDHYRRFKDPEFAYGIALAETAGRATLRLANADLLPFEFDHFYKTMAEYLKEVMETADKMRKEADGLQANLKEHLYELAADPNEPLYQPKAPQPVPYLNFAPLQNALTTLETNAKQLEALLKTDLLPAQKRTQLNALLYHAERQLVREEGLPRRPWFRHQIYAPGFYTGYGVKTLPGVREAIEQGDWQEAQEQIDFLARVFTEYNAYLEKMLTAGK